MQVRTEKNKLILIPENDGDIFNLGRVSMKFAVETHYTASTDNDVQLDKMVIKNINEFINKLAMETSCKKEQQNY